MTNKKIIIGIIPFLIIALGLVFTFLSHDLHEAVTFGLNIPHFLHFVMGLVIIGISIKNGTFRIDFQTFQAIKKYIITNKRKTLAGTLTIAVVLILLKTFIPTEVKAETDFDKVKEIAKEYCTNPTSTDQRCLESFKELKDKSSHKKVQQTAQEQFGVVGNYTTNDFDPMEYLTTWNFNNLAPEERSKYYKETKLPDGKTLR